MAVSTAALELIIKLRDEASKGLSAIGGTLQTALGVVGGGLITKGLDAITGSIGNLVDSMVSGNAEFERYQTQFGVLLGSAEKAKERLDELAKFGASTPFELPGVVRADKILQSFGLHSEESAQKFKFSGEQIRTIAGDVAAGTGASFEEMSLLLGKFSTGATGEAIARMAELGIASRAELAALGLEFSKSGELLSPLPESMEVVLKLMQKKFGGMMEAQSRTFEGMMSNLQDWVSGTLRIIGQPIFEVLKDKLGVLLQFLSSPSVQNAITNVANLIANGIGQAISLITGLIDSFGASGGLESAFPPELIAIVQDLGTAIQSMVAFVVTNLPTFQAVFQNVFDVVTSIVQALVPVVSTVLDQIAKFWKENGDEIMQFVSEAWTTISEIIAIALELIRAIVIPILTGIAQFISTHGDEIRGVFSIVWDAIKTIVDTALKAIKLILTVALNLVKGDTQSALNLVRAYWENLKGALEIIVSNMATAIANGFDQIKNSIVNAISSAYNSVVATLNNWRAVGEGIVQGIIGGINSIGSQITTAIANYVLNAIRSAMDSINKFLALFGIGPLPIPGFSKSSFGRSSFGNAGSATDKVSVGSSLSLAGAGAQTIYIDARGASLTESEIEAAFMRALNKVARTTDVRIRTR